ncbi:MAG: 50S ribosomal protein L23 [Candidatus Saccharibacteria bacterium]|nr:50S ribosomal protein L23 [Candidatus Saccharibacteria bacterium]
MADVTLYPRLSEKAYNTSQKSPVYVFEVDQAVSKQALAQAVAKTFSVEVVSVNVLNTNGKRKRTYISRRGRFVKGQRSDYKKAYVTIKAGQSIPIFAADEEAEAKAEKQTKQLKKVVEKAEKKADKKAAKETK